MSKRDEHPSGRPIRKTKVGVRSIWRIPDRGPVIPRLQREEGSIEAIGFTARIAGDDDE